MRTTVEVERAGDRVRCVLRAGHLAPRVLAQTDRGVTVALVATGALLLGGDHVRVDVRVGDGVALELVETSGTVAYHGRGRASSWVADVRVGRGASLVWDALPFVVSDGADVTRTTNLHVHDEGAALLRETLVLGRDGQRGGPLRSATRAAIGGRDLLVEELDLTGPHTAPGVLGDARVVDSVLLAGRRPVAADGGDARDDETRGLVVLDLHRPGALARAVGSAAHVADVGPLVGRWRAALPVPTVHPHPAADPAAHPTAPTTDPETSTDAPGTTGTDDRSTTCMSPTT
ncbi:urease accessory protein UreD [Cellulomonas sp. CW35]|uniref:urease accessory protein UreD n=1 Tax=Cellulomonas sp. CW35 TaxID=3458249 RepID=UPI0040348CA7